MSGMNTHMSGTNRRLRIYERFMKRPMDIVFAASAIVVLCPLLVIVALLVRIKLGSPVLFSQKRPGLNERVFTMYKFRTMTNERDTSGSLLPDERRLTRFGRILRSTSLDELPELFNVIKGDMSIVGPRPLLIRYLPYYTEEERQRHRVRPGLTGLAQVNGRNLLGWDDRISLDVRYVHSISFVGDMRILIATLKQVVQRKDIVMGNQHKMADLDVERSKSGHGDIPALN